MYMVLKMSLNSNHSALWQTPIVVLHVFWSNWHRYFYKPDTLPVSQPTASKHLWNDQQTVIYNVYCGDVCVYFVQRNSQMNLCVSTENNTLLLGMCFSVFMSLLNFQHCHDTVKLHCMRNSFLLQILGLRIVSGVLCVSLIVVSLYCCILKVIDDRGYWLTVVTVCVCSTVLMLLKMVVEYSQLTSDIPSAAPEILNRLIELLKVLFCVINF